jgi:hypothetical protein
MNLFGRIREGLTRTTQQIVGRFDEIVSRADDPTIAGSRGRRHAEALEELLISADVGVAASERIIGAVKARAPLGGSLRDLVKEEMRAIFAEASTRDRQRPLAARRAHRRRQRHGQDDHGRQAGEPGPEQRADAAHLRGRHVSGRGRRAARDLGEPRVGRHRPRARGQRPGGRRLRRALVGQGPRPRPGDRRHRRDACTRAST